MKRNSDALKLRTKTFALRVLNLYRSLPRTQEARILGTQLLRCSTRSRAEFVAKLGIVLEEADETVFWLELLQEGKIFSPEKLRDLVQEANELLAIFVTSVSTAKQPLQSDL